MKRLRTRLIRGLPIWLNRGCELRARTGGVCLDILTPSRVALDAPDRAPNAPDVDNLPTSPAPSAARPSAFRLVPSPAPVSKARHTLTPKQPAARAQKYRSPSSAFKAGLETCVGMHRQLQHVQDHPARLLVPPHDCAASLRLRSGVRCHRLAELALAEPLLVQLDVVDCGVG